MWRNLKSMGWKRTEPLWGASAEPRRAGKQKDMTHERPAFRLPW
ncbi:hypothetical protein [Parasynechococcus marenigrum]|nr:hypothetical protein [Parasynechococcus marenigrum]